MAADPASPYTRTALVWAGKRTQVDRIALPFQRVESVKVVDVFGINSTKWLEVTV